MKQELENVFSAEELSKNPEEKSIGFIGKSGRLVAVTTILTFSLIGPLSQQSMAQSVNTEISTVSNQSDIDDQFVVAINDNMDIPIWFAECHGNFVECTALHEDCLLFYKNCPTAFCDPKIGE